MKPTSSLFLALALSSTIFSTAVQAEESAVLLDSETRSESPLRSKGTAANPEGMWFFIGGQTGWTSVNSSRDSFADGPHLNFKALGSYYMRSKPWLFDAGLGFQSNTLETQDTDSNTGGLYIEGSGRYRFDQNWQLGPVANLMFGENPKFADNTSGTSTLIGVSGIYETTIRNDFPFRIGGRLMTDLTIKNRTVTMALVEVAIGWPGAQPQAVSQVEQEELVVDGVEETVETEPLYTKPVSMDVRPTTSVAFSHQAMVFPMGRVEPTTGAEDYIRRLARVLLKNQHLFDSISIVGHTDSLGKSETNRILSEGRARKAIEIMSTEGMPAAKLQGTGVADLSPIVRDKDPKKWAPNRRIEIQFLGVRDADALNEALRSL